MITLIHITEKQTGKILDYIPIGDFWDDNHHKSLKDTLEYFEFRTFGDKRYSQHLEKMNRIIIPDEDGTFVEFVIFHAIKYRLQNAVVVDVYAPASYLLLKKAKVIKPQKLEGYTAAQHADFALAGTEWKVGRVDYAGIRTITIESHTNPYAYLKRIASEFDLELHFRVEVDGNKVIGRYVDLLERVGEWQGREVEFGRDLLGIERKVDDSNVVTALIGLAPERDDGTRLEVMVEDEEALQRWGIPNPQTGELMHLIETYEPESTDQDMTIARLTELTRNELEKRISSVVEYTADVADLEKVPGMENKKIRFGDTIKIKDTGFNPPLYLEARVHTQDRSLSQPEKKKVTLGDFIEYTEEEVHAIWKQLQSEVRRRITAKQLYDYTYPKLVIDSKDEEVRTDVESYARTVAVDAKNEAITYTNNTLEPIAVRVDNVEEDIKNHQGLISKAQTDIIQAYNEIELRATKTEVDALSGRVSTVESTIQQHADMIESKIDDGQARSIFRQEADSFTFDADQINFKGHVFGEDATFTGRLEAATGTFSGNLTSSELTIGPEKPDLPALSNGAVSLRIKMPERVTDKSFRFAEDVIIKSLNNTVIFTRDPETHTFWMFEGDISATSIDTDTFRTKSVRTQSLVFTSFDSPPLSVEGAIWYGDGYRGKGLYVRDDVGWRKLQIVP